MWSLYASKLFQAAQKPCTFLLKILWSQFVLKSSEEAWVWGPKKTQRRMQRPLVRLRRRRREVGARQRRRSGQRAKLGKLLLPKLVIHNIFLKAPQWRGNITIQFYYSIQPWPYRVVIKKGLLTVRLTIPLSGRGLYSSLYQYIHIDKILQF